MFEQVMPDGEDYKFGSLPYGAHQKIIKYVGSNKKVLDVGCADGYLGKEFKNNGCFVVGIEGMAQRIKTAREILDDVVTGNIEGVKTLPYPENFFDVIVFADVLEHLMMPEAVLANFKKYLKKEGSIIISVPNIARIDVRLKLLLGKFNYAQGGILDKTHLRFFTLDSIQRLLIESGYVVTRKDSSGYFSRFRMFSFLSKLLAFQFILLAKPV